MGQRSLQYLPEQRVKKLDLKCMHSIEIKSDALV